MQQKSIKSLPLKFGKIHPATLIGTPPFHYLNYHCSAWTLNEKYSTRSTDTMNKEKCVHFIVLRTSHFSVNNNRFWNSAKCACEF